MKRLQIKQLIQEEIKSLDFYYVGDIEQDTVYNTSYRKVIATHDNLQLVLMSIQPGDSISSEIHESGDQFLRIESGTGQIVINGQTYTIQSDWAVTIPAGSKHDVINTGDIPLKLYSIYAPPEHKSGLEQKSKK